MARNKEFGDALRNIMADFAKAQADYVKQPEKFGEFLKQKIILEERLSHIFSAHQQKPLTANIWVTEDGVNATVWDLDKDTMQ